jgi:hypothetical protein
MKLIVLGVVLLMVVLLAGCATPVQVDCRLPQPPASLLTIPAPLPPIPADLPRDKP